MTRRQWCLLTLAIAGCRKAADFPPDLFPEAVAGVWRRTSLRDVPVSESQDPVPRTSVERLKIATYEGAGKIEARVYLLSSSAAGLDLAQRWRPSADTVFFNQGVDFVVVKWEAADRKALQTFVSELEKRLAPKK